VTLKKKHKNIGEIHYLWLFLTMFEFISESQFKIPFILQFKKPKAEGKAKPLASP
jgi:hypothetical protein